MAELEPQLVHDVTGNLVLDSEDIRQFVVIFARPQWEVVADANQLGVDAQLLAREQDRTFENIFGIKLLSNIVRVLRLAFESKRRRLGSNRQTVDNGQVADDFAGEAVRKVVVVRIAI